MVSHGILNFNLVSDIIESSDIYAVLEETISVIYCMRDNLTSVEYAGDFFEQESSGISFADWLYDYNSQPELRDMKKELSILINKGIEIDSILYQTYLQAVDKLDGNDGLIMTVCRRETNVLYVSNISQYWKARQWYLSRYVERSGFVTETGKKGTSHVRNSAFEQAVWQQSSSGRPHLAYSSWRNLWFYWPQRCRKNNHDQGLLWDIAL